jgi:large subunit ribosomal protein L22
MLSAEKFRKVCEDKRLSTGVIAEHLVRGGMDLKDAVSAVRNWRKGFFKPVPGKRDVETLAAGLGVRVVDISEWKSVYRYAPGSARKAGLVTQLINGRRAQDALDLLKFTRKRAASMVIKILKTAIADADEQQADVDNLYVRCATADDAGIRVGTKRFRAKDRGRAHSIHQKACHITVTVAEV